MGVWRLTEYTNSASYIRFYRIASIVSPVERHFGLLSLVKGV